MNNNNKYCIVVGDGGREKTIKVGTIERGSGSTLIKERGETLARRGDIMFSNECNVWAARAINGKIDKNGRAVDITDPDYKGELIGLKWGDPKGMLIRVRYIKGLPSLDILYQENRLNFKINDNLESSADAYFLQFPMGENDFNEDSDKLLVQHLKWHSYNPNSISKDPQFFTSMFYERSFEQQETANSAIIDHKFEAATIVRKCGEGGDSIAKCKNLFSIVKSASDGEPEDGKLYAHLKIMADNYPVEFLRAVADYKAKVSDVFEKAKTFEAVDWVVDGTLATTGKNKEILISGLPTKKDGIFDYLLENFTEPKVFNVTYKLNQITDKL